MNSCNRLFKLSKTIYPLQRPSLRDQEHVVASINFFLKRRSSDDIKGSNLDSESKDLVKIHPKEILEKEFPECFSDGKFITRMSYIDFVDQGLDRIKELGLQRELGVYKELLKIFPPGKYCPKSNWDLGLFHAPQQLCALRVLNQMDIHGVIPDKETERIIVERFSIRSQVWMKCGRMNYWFRKFRNLDPNPLPEVVPDKIHEVAKIALVRMLDDPKSIVSITNTSTLPNVLDKTWVVYSQSPIQKDIINRLPEKSLLYIEDAGLTYVKDKYLSYYILKVYDDEETNKRRHREPEPNFNYNTIKMKFYCKPIREKLKDLEELHHDGTGYILSIGMTGTSSHDSILSWLKLLQNRNPRLKEMNVLFKFSRPTMDLLDPDRDPEKSQDEHEATN